MITWRSFFSNRKVVAALVIILTYIAIAISAPLLSPPEDPDNPLPYKTVGSIADTSPHPPSKESPFGTLPRQLDIYHSVIWGARSALRFGLTVTLSTALIGILIGSAAGYAGGRINRISMRVTDAFLTFPPLVGILLFQLLLTPIAFIAVGNQFVISVRPTGLQSALSKLHLNPVMVALILFSWMAYARMINASVLQLKQSEFILAAKSIGMRDIRIIARHLLPNIIGPIIVMAARDVGGMVILESAFAFLGASGYNEWGWGWGDILVESRNWIIGPGGNPTAYWWVFIPATFALVLFCVGWNLLGNGLNDLLNPHKNYHLI